MMNRRELLRIGFDASAGLLIGLTLPGCAERPETVIGAGGDIAIGPWVRIHPDNSSTVMVARIEMGQRVHAAMARMIAEEMDLAWDTLHLRQAPLAPDTYGWQSTFGSGSVSGSWIPLREAATAARDLLLRAGAKALDTTIDRIELRDSHAIDRASGRKLGYIGLAPLVLEQHSGLRRTPKRRADYRLIGKPAPAPELRTMVTGEARYASDLRLPDMLYAVIARPPSIGAELDSYDAGAALAMHGVIKVMTVSPQAPPVGVRGGVAVIARSAWVAMQARAALEMHWREPQAALSSAGLREQMRATLARPGDEVVAAIGEPDALLQESSGLVEAEYELPLLAHVTMEPMTCTAHVSGGRCRVWAPTQAPDQLPQEISRFLGIEQSAVELVVTRFGGGLGRRVNRDFVFEAVALAQQLEQPVQVVWTREDDMLNDFYRPASMHRLTAAQGEDGKPRALRHRITSTAIAAYLDPAKQTGFGAGEANGAVNMPYRIAARSCEYSLARSPVPVGWWRSVDLAGNVFAVESFVDELAHAAGADPLEFRLGLIDRWQQEWPRTRKDFPLQPERLRTVLRRAAMLGRHGSDEVRVGLACAYIHHTYAALAVSLEPGSPEPRIRSMSCVIDCGIVVDPDGARAQIEGGLVHGLSASLMEGISLRAGKVEQDNLDSYPLLRMAATPPAIDIEFTDSDAHPTGLGEISTPLVAPALANAIFHASGKRMRRLPLQV